jgi:hypothetical protein
MSIDLVAPPAHDTVPHPEPPPPVQMVQLLAGFQIAQALYVTAKLDVATALLDGPTSVGDLATRTGADPDMLGRLIRTLAGLGVFRQTEPGVYALTALGETLAVGTPGSVRDLALTWMETHYAAFGDLLGGVRAGEPAATLHYGRPFFDWLSTQPEQVQCFTGAMANLTHGIKAHAIAGYTLPAGPTVADIGGADGSVLGALLAGDPDPARRGIVFDLPHVVPAARARMAELGLEDRVEAVAGDFFQSVPAADVYVVSMILHDWDDTGCAALLRRIAQAARPGAHLVAVEFVVPPGDEMHMSKMIDLTMLGMLTGRERTLQEFDELLGAAGFRMERVVNNPTPLSILEAVLTDA